MHPLAEVSFGEWLKRRRRGMGLTQQQLAARINYSTIALKKIEAEERRPSPEIVERLAEIFDIPTHEREKFLRFARGDWRSAPASEATPWRNAASTPRSNLPASLTSLIGRKRDVEILCEYLSDDSKRLITLIGPPGIGKTRLSIEAARQSLHGFTDGVFFIALAPLEDPSFVAPTITQILGFVETTRQASLKRLENGIGDKQMLIVLDNVEHLIEGVAILVSHLLSACPHLKIITTSREALRVPGEWLTSVPTLSIPTATQLQSVAIEDTDQYTALSLFAERARAVRADFVLNVENVQAVASLCTQLDGLPLAIELIAARIRLMSPESLLLNLNEQLILNADGMRAVSARQKTLHNTIGWSYDLLPAKEKILFRRLAVFVVGWTLEAAQAVCSDESIEVDQIPDLLMHLVDKSLVIVEGKKRIMRYSSLETIRQFAGEKLWEAGEGDVMRQRHLTYFVDLAERAEPNLRAFDMVMWLDQFEAELDNIRAALRWAQESDVESQLRLASALLWFWHIRGHRYEGIDWLERGLSIELMERGDGAITPNRAMIRGKALNASGEMMGESSIAKAAERFQESLELFKQLGTPGKHGMAYALNGLARWTDTITRKAMQEQSLTLFREVGDKFGVAECLMPLAAYARLEGDFVRARSLGKEQLDLYEEIGDKDGVAIAHTELGNTSLVEGDYQQAMKFYERSLAGFHEVGNKWGIVQVLSCLSIALMELGNPEQATRTLEEALAIAQGLGDKSLIADRLDDLGKVAWAQGSYELAANRYEEELRISREAANKDAAASALLGLGRVAQSQEDFAAARSLYSEAIMLAQETNKAWIVARHLAALANLLSAQKEPEIGVRLFSAIENLVPFIGLEMSIREHAEYDRARIASYDALDEETLAVALAQGQAMTLEQAIAYALENLSS